MDLALKLNHESYNEINICKPVFQPVRGEIYLARMPVTKEKTVIQKGDKRPVVITSCEATNVTSGFCNYLAITSRTTKAILPTHVQIGTESGLLRSSVVIAEQTMSIDKEDLIFRIGQCPNSKMQEIDNALLKQLDLHKYVEAKELKEKTDDEQAKQEMIAKRKKSDLFKSIISAINTLNELIYDLKTVNNEILKLRDSRLTELCQACLLYKINYQNLLEKKINHYDKMK